MWAALFALLLCARTWPEMRPWLDNDSAVYLSVAGNLQAGNGAATSIVHFDEERRMARLPAPMVTFPSGYPALTAVVAATGLTLEHAALLVSIVSMILALLLTLRLAAVWQLSSPAMRILAFLLVFNTGSVRSGVTAASEALFTALTLAFVVAFVEALRSPAGARRWGFAVLAGLALGAGYWVRYAGLFLCVGLVAVVVGQIFRRRWTDAIAGIVTGAVASMFVLAGLWRNVQLSGNWRGGNSKVVFKDPLQLAKTTAKAADHLLFGERTVAMTLGLRVACLVACAGLLGVLWQHRRRWMGSFSIPRQRQASSGILLTLVVVYSVLMLYAGLTTMISFGARMYVPVLPLLLALGVLAVTRLLPSLGRVIGESRPALALGVLALSLYAATNLVDGFGIPLNLHAERVDRRLDARREAAPSARDFVDAGVPVGSAIVANDGQLTGYLLRRPTLSLVERHFSDVVWDESAVRALFETYDAGALVLSLTEPGEDPETMLPSEFLRGLAEGRAPSWLREAAFTGRVRIYVPTRP